MSDRTAIYAKALQLEDERNQLRQDYDAKCAELETINHLTVAMKAGYEQRITELEADLKAAQDHSDCHDLVCNGSRQYPRGKAGHGCSCKGRDGAYADLAAERTDHAETKRSLEDKDSLLRQLAKEGSVWIDKESVANARLQLVYDKQHASALAAAEEAAFDAGAEWKSAWLHAPTYETAMAATQVTRDAALVRFRQEQEHT